MPTALIWGASGGIGSALVTALSERGWSVHAAARDESKIPPAAVATYPFEAADEYSIQQVCLLVARAVESVDLVVYAAGGLTPAALDRLSGEDWQATLDANLTGAYLTLRYSLDLLTKEGHALAIGAYVGKITLPRMGAYVVAKAGLEPLMTIFQKENRKRRFTLVRLPAVDTPFWRNVPFSLPDYALKPAEVAEKIIAHVESGGSGELNV